MKTIEITIKLVPIDEESINKSDLAMLKLSLGQHFFEDLLKRNGISMGVKLLNTEITVLGTEKKDEDSIYYRCPECKSLNIDVESCVKRYSMCRDCRFNDYTSFFISTMEKDQLSLLDSNADDLKRIGEVSELMKDFTKRLDE